MSQDPVPLGQLRVGHAERDAVAEILQAAAADGRLGLDELDERLGVALQARTYADLEGLLCDLSVDVPWRATPTPAVQPVRTQGPPPVGYSREDPLRLEGGLSSEKRDGSWVIPPFVRLGSGMGSVKLNCLLARPAAGVIEVEVVPGAGSVLIILPDGWGVDADRLTKSMGSKTIKVPRDPAPGKPLLVFYGGVGLGSFKVRPGSRRELRRIEDAPSR